MGYDISKIKDLRRRLEDLQRFRLGEVKQGRSVSGSDLTGWCLYEDALKEVCVIMNLIKEKFPHRVAESPLFEKVDKSYWQLGFRDNFYKLFIDRIRVNGHKISSYDSFNRGSLSVGDRLGCDLCYGEGFAVGFLVMLTKVYDAFEQGKTLEDLSAGEVMDLFLELNSTATGLPKDDNVARSEMKCGGNLQYQWVLQREDLRDKFGATRTVYDFRESMVRTSFAPDFRHRDFSEELFRSFKLEHKENPDNFDIVLCDLVAAYDSYSHLCRDGNARTSLLTGWFLAMLNGKTLPVLIEQCRVSKEMVEEGRSWVDAFCDDPKYSSLPSSYFGILSQAKQNNHDYFRETHANAAELFMVDLLFGGHRFDGKRFCISLDMDVEELCLVESNLFQLSGKLFNPDDFAVAGKGAIKSAIVYDFGTLKEILASNPDLSAQEDVNKRNAEIARLLLGNFGQKEQLSQGQKNLCKAVILKYRDYSFDAEKKEEFTLNLVACESKFVTKSPEDTKASVVASSSFLAYSA
jgi:hypothetical protein